MYMKAWNFSLYFLFFFFTKSFHIQRLVPVSLTSALLPISHFVKFLVKECGLVSLLHVLQDAVGNLPAERQKQSWTCRMSNGAKLSALISEHESHFAANGQPHFPHIHQLFLWKPSFFFFYSRISYFCFPFQEFSSFKSISQCLRLRALVYFGSVSQEKHSFIFIWIWVGERQSGGQIQSGAGTGDGAGVLHGNV